MTSYNKPPSRNAGIPFVRKKSKILSCRDLSKVLTVPSEMKRLVNALVLPPEVLSPLGASGGAQEAAKTRVDIVIANPKRFMMSVFENG